VSTKPIFDLPEPLYIILELVEDVLDFGKRVVFPESIRPTAGSR